MLNWATAKSIFSNNYFFSKNYTNKFIENVGQYVTKATFSETTEDRGQKHIQTPVKHLKWSSFSKILGVVNLDA